MKQLTGLDGTFLYMETPTTFGHVTGLGIYERPSASTSTRTPRCTPGSPRWSASSSRCVGGSSRCRSGSTTRTGSTTPTSTSTSTSASSASPSRAASISSPSRSPGSSVGRWTAAGPLWEVYVIDGLESGRWALLTKYHHATIDGASGQLMLEIITDTEPTPRRRARARRGSPSRSRATSSCCAWRSPTWLRNPLRGVAGADAHRARLRRRRRDHQRQRPRPAGRCAIKRIAAARRRRPAALLAADHRRARRRRGTRPSPRTGASPCAPVSLDNIKRLKDATGGTVNDVVMAICAGGLARVPAAPRRAARPPAAGDGAGVDPHRRRGRSVDQPGLGIVADLPTDEPDPLERVARCREAMNAAKRQFELVPAAALVDLTQYSSPVVATSAIRLAARLRLADRVAPPVNVIISNVPGPRQPLYLAGAQLPAVSPSRHRRGDGAEHHRRQLPRRARLRSRDRRELVPDLWDLADMHIDEIDTLFDATGAEWAQPPRPAPPPPRGRRTSGEQAGGQEGGSAAGGAPSLGDQGAAGSPHPDRPQEGQGLRRQTSPQEDQGRRGQASSHEGQGVRRQDSGKAGPPKRAPRKAKAAAQ